MANKKTVILSDKIKDTNFMRSQWWSKYRKDEDDTVFEALKHMEEIIKNHEPDNSNGFSGGYMQRLSSDNSLVLFYGTDSNRNRVTENLQVSDEQFEYLSDIFHIYMHYFQKINKPKRKKVIL